MTIFFITLAAVAMMLGYAVPGYILVKTKLIKEDAIVAFARVLMYLCAPCLTIYTFDAVDFDKQLIFDALVVLLVSMGVMVGLILLFKFIFRKKNEDVKYRVATIATAMGNCGFMGVPLLEAIIPEHPEATMMSSVFCVGMNFIGWTLSSYVISNDKKYMRVKNALLNPSTLSLIIAIPLFVFSLNLPQTLSTMVILLGKMTAPLCMLIMGMRLATMSFRAIFLEPLTYPVMLIKQFAMPLITLLIMKLLPVDNYLVETMFILTAVPVASVVLNFAEMIGQGQKNAANMVLLSTMSCIITIPVMMLLYNIMF